MKLSFNDIKENCSKIHYFGLGFIQVMKPMSCLVAARRHTWDT